MADESGEKTEEPTHKKIEDSRKKGQVWKSQDLTAVAVFLVGMGIVKATWPLVEREMRSLFGYGFDKVAHPHQLERAVTEVLWIGGWSFALMALPLIVGVAVIAGLADFLQVGALLSLESVLPKLEHIDPLHGLKEMFSKKALVEMIKSTGKIGIASYVVYGAIRDSMGPIVMTIRSQIPMINQVLGDLVQRISIRVGILFTVFAAFDVWWQHRSYMQDLKMTKDEVKREYRESEGDPHHKAKRKELHMEILEGAQMEAVQSADVIVTNPHHVAVALKYESGVDRAPRVLAVGTDEVAQAIKALAVRQRIPLVRNVPLARSLVASAIGDEVPEALYAATAEILSFVQGMFEAQRVLKGIDAGG